MHTRWTVQAGAPNGIYDVRQTPDGYLWLASQDGLYRFDGVTFESIPAPAGSPMENKGLSSLLVRKSGELWVGFELSGGVAAYRQGKLVDMRMPSPPASVHLMETTDGTVWASYGGRNAGNKRLRRYLGGRWEDVADRLYLPGGMVRSMAVRPDGSLWLVVGSESAMLVRLPAGGARFQVINPHVPIQAKIGVDNAGRLWMTDPARVFMLIDRDGTSPASAITLPAAPTSAGHPFAFDRRGGLWVATGSAGIFYASPEDMAAPARARLQRFDARAGLTSDLAESTFVDREGNVWVGGIKGLDQFRPAPIVSEPVFEGDSSQRMMAQARDGSVYISSGRGVFEIAPGKAPRRRMTETNWIICRARDRGAWVVSPKGEAFKIDGDRRIAGPRLPPGMEEPGTCGEDKWGRFWLRLYSLRLLWHDAAGWHQATAPAKALQQADHWDLTDTPNGGLAFLRNANLSLVQLQRNGGSATPLGSLKVDPLTRSGTGLDAIFVGGNDGLIRVRGRVPEALRRDRFDWLTRMRSLIQTAAGDTWLLSQTGLFQIATADLNRAFDDPHAPLPHRLFDSRDGWEGSVQGWGMAGPQIAAGSDGRIWFAGFSQILSLDLTRIARNPAPPNVVVRWLRAGGRFFRDPSDLKLAAGTRALEISYAGLSLAVPDRIAFRYRLEGVDEQLVDPGTRRTASYANLAAGRYRFTVIAANEEGVWNRTGTTLEFEILPTVVESNLFRGLCALAVVALLWLAYALRVRVIVHRARARMIERMEEREHIARELHDTLLQSVQTLTLRFQLAVEDLPEDLPARAHLEQSIDRADEVIADGRDRLRSLRPLSPAKDLPEILADLVLRQGFPESTRVSLVTAGAARAVAPLAIPEIADVAAEALFNIWRHAKAAHVGIELRYDTSLVLRIADDGIGIPAEILERGGKAGHFGLPGIHERARKLGGSLLITSRPQGGTTVTLTMPGTIAYQKARHGRFVSLFKKARPDAGR